jgi:UDP-N-acetylmuramyl pentapeptide phosphotransferase/UDP-N-acetylglucosamine-1-phosphate transferase
MLALGLFFIGILLTSWGANRLLLKWLLAQDIVVDPISRSGHTVPTPVGAGLAVMAVILVGALALQCFGLGLPKAAQLATIATLGLAVILVWVSWHDDLRDNHGLRVRYRLALQGLATIVPLCLLPAQFDIIPFLQAPMVIERTIVALGWWWFTNLYNFMDGINGITVTETSSICVGVLLLALFGGVANTYFGSHLGICLF